MKVENLSNGFPWYVTFKVNIKYYYKVVRYNWYSLHALNQMKRRDYKKIKDTIRSASCGMKDKL